MGQISKRDILNVFDKLDVNYTSTKIKDGDFDSSEYTLFLITQNNILIYFIHFTVTDTNDSSCYTISGDMFFITSNGSIFSDWVKMEESYIIKSEIKEAFIVKHDEENFDYMDLDNEIIEIMNDSKPVVKTEVDRQLSNFINCRVEIL